jgi:hypothetical protein
MDQPGSIEKTTAVTGGVAWTEAAVVSQKCYYYRYFTDIIPLAIKTTRVNRED